MRILALSVLLAGLCLGGVVHAQAADPGAMQDAEAAREKLLKASDQLDLMEANSETTKTTLAALQAQMAKVQDQNAALTQQVAALQEELRKSEADHAKERQVLLDEVAKMVASGRSTSSTHLSRKKEIAPADTAPAMASTPAGESAAVGTKNPAEDTAAADSTPKPAGNAAATAGNASGTAEPAAKTQKGYFHIVEKHETLTMICSAYREQGVKVTVAEIRKANNLTENSILKVGQKLFIPKPGTAL